MNFDKNLLVIVLIVIIAVLGGLLWQTNQTQESNDEVEQENIQYQDNEKLEKNNVINQENIESQEQENIQEESFDSVSPSDVIQEKCEDGTFYNECSENKPKYCDNGNLINNCDLCECPLDKNKCLKNGSCSQFFENVGCENNHYKMAFILLVKNSNDTTSNRIAKLSTIKDNFSQYFFTATENMAQMDTSDDIYVMVASDSMFDRYHNESANYVISNEVTKKFYEEYNNIYDFISIYTAFSTDEYQNHVIVIQNIKGIGMSLVNYSDIYGSKDKLKGVNFMGSIDMYNASDPSSINGLLHETGHQWCCYAGDNFVQGQDGAKLEIIQEGIHFYVGLQSPYEIGTPMGSRHWVVNNDATFRADNKNGFEKYHPFQLYFMGLLPTEEYNSEFQIYNAGITGSWNFESAIPYKQVSVNDIIKLEGQRGCISNE